MNYSVRADRKCVIAPNAFASNCSGIDMHEIRLAVTTNCSGEPSCKQVREFTRSIDRGLWNVRIWAEYFKGEHDATIMLRLYAEVSVGHIRLSSSATASIAIASKSEGRLAVLRFEIESEVRLELLFKSMTLQLNSVEVQTILTRNRRHHDLGSFAVALTKC